MNFYVSIFKESMIKQIHRFETPMGKAMTGTFQIAGQDFMALDGGLFYSITPGISFFVPCETQEEIDYYWEKLSDGGEIMQCGWLTDKFGVTWQIVPSALGSLLHSDDPVRSRNAMTAMLQMKKLDIEELKRAYGN
jgi:predicted 3-demethylubiquinone-9 3-methyltransferase (glyoxalase superfamily)